MPRLRREESLRALGMLQAGVSLSAAARQFRCNVSTISRLRSRYQATGSAEDRPRRGRQRVTTPAQDMQMVRQHLQDRFRPATRTAAGTPGRNQPRISPSTVRRRLREQNLQCRRPFRGPVLTPLHRQNRMVWCRQRLWWTPRIHWRHIMFSDESRFCLNRPDGRERVWRRPGERVLRCCIRQEPRGGGPSVMMWGGISYDHRTPLIPVVGNLNAQRYIDQILRPVLVPFLQAHPIVSTFQQDNARPHTARLTTAFLQQHNVRLLPWPAVSPDLSPIEHLWDQLGQRVSARRPAPNNRQQLIAVLQQEWNAIPQQRIQRLIRSMPRRCRVCVAVNGGHTGY